LKEMTWLAKCHGRAGTDLGTKLGEFETKLPGGGPRKLQVKAPK